MMQHDRESDEIITIIPANMTLGFYVSKNKLE
ncbi:hypothetical protein HALA3H3_800125 [Halomonas sp. A3H3]|nr:hypothetical protein HALA3H3_800125 [Halomonas sp. A3H3]